MHNYIYNVYGLVATKRDLTYTVFSTFFPIRSCVEMDG